MKINIPKAYKFPLILFVVIIFLILLFFYYNPPTTQTSNLPTKESVLSDKKYFLNKTDGQQTSHYVGDTKSSNYSVYVQEGEKIKYYIDKNPSDFEFQSLDEFIQKYKEFNLELYGPWYDKVGYKSYVFLKSGLIVIAHPFSKSIVEVWHIDKNLDNTTFFDNFSSNFSINQPPSQNTH